MGIREIRRARNITQKELAEVIGVNETVVSRYEKGVVTPPANRLKIMADYLQVSVDQLLDNNKPAMPVDFVVKGEEDHFIEMDKYESRSFEAARRILAYSKGICELCGGEAPFSTGDGEPYLEAHFVEWLSEGGRPTLDNVVALCPNCHKKIHIVHSKDDIEYLRKIAKQHEEL